MLNLSLSGVLCGVLPTLSTVPTLDDGDIDTAEGVAFPDIATSNEWHSHYWQSIFYNSSTISDLAVMKQFTSVEQ